jgi:hypothetical protein
MCVSTGNKGLDIALAIGIGAATGGMSAPMTAGLGGTLTPTLTASLGHAITGWGVTSITAGMVGGAVLGGVGSLAMSALMPQQPTQAAYPTYSYEPTYNYQQNQVTGSGGAQAPAHLATAIKRAKDARKKEEAVGDTYINTETFSGTGLQLA